MQTSTIIPVIIALVIGLGGGYLVADSSRSAPSTHMMSDGSTMSDAMSGMMMGLEGKTGDAFDQAFIEEMIVHHEGAVVMAEQALQLAKHEEIKQLANEIIAAQTKEINMMRGWLQTWYGANIE